MDQPALTSKAKAEIVIAKLLKGRDFFNHLKKYFDSNCLISGQPISHWEKRFRISVPIDNLTPQLCIELATRIMELYQEASFFYAAAQALHQYIKRGSDLTYLSTFRAKVEEFKAKGGRMPSAVTLETLARADVEDVESAGSQAELETKYWKQILDHLSTCRRLVENASLNISVELKAEMNQKYLDNLDRKSNRGDTQF